MSEARFDENGLPVEGPAPASKSHRPTSVVTLTIIAINVVVYLAMVVKGVSPTSPTARDVIPWGASFGPLTTGGQWWRLLTECFVHFGIIHIGINMYILFQVGMFTELLFGKVRYIVIYLAAGLAGSAVSLYVHPLGVSAGASGAIFGVFGALLAFLMIERGVIPTRAAMQIAKSAALFLLYNLVYGLADGRTDLSAHIGGLVTGFMVGCLLLLRPRAAGRARMPIAQILAVIFLTACAGAAGLHFVPKVDRGSNDWNRQSMTGARVPAANGGTVIYSGSASRADAEKLAKGLDEAKFFARQGGVVLLSKGKDGTSISIPVGPDEKAYLKAHPQAPDYVNAKPGAAPAKPAAPVFPWNDPRTIAAFTVTGVKVAPLVGGPPIKMLLLTDTGEVKRTIPIDTREVIIGSRDSVWYSGAATEKDAQALGAALQLIGLFRGNGGWVMLGNGAAGTEISFVGADRSWDDPRVAAAFGAIVQRVAGSVGGLPVTVRLLDSTLQARQTFVVK